MVHATQSFGIVIQSSVRDPIQNMIKKLQIRCLLIATDKICFPAKLCMDKYAEHYLQNIMEVIITAVKGIHQTSRTNKFGEFIHVYI